MTSEPRRRASLVVVLAALLPLCFAGWLLWQSFSGKQDPSGGAFPVAGSTEQAANTDGDRSRGPQNDAARGAPGGGREKAGKRDGSGRDGAGREKPGKHDGSGRDRPLAGKVVVLDPGHNVNNYRHVEEIGRQVDAGTFRKDCDTAGASTADGYSEASFTMDVARRARSILRAEGATVKLTHDGKRPWGPCVDERAGIGNRAHADAAVSIHADGAGPGDHGFHVILPGAIREKGTETEDIVRPSRALGKQIREHFAAETSLPPANYVGGDTGLTTRKDLGGLNLSHVPKVFIECGNLRNRKEAEKLHSPQWRQRAAEGIAEGVSRFLTRRP